MPQSSLRKQFIRALAVVMMIPMLALPLKAQTSNHIVSSEALQQQVQSQSNTRQQNIQTVQQFFATPLAHRAMQMEKVSPEQIQKAIPTLSSSELANLSARASHAQQQFAAGALTTSQMLLLIIVLLIVVILVAVH
jgi:hypothetical protein